MPIELKLPTADASQQAVFTRVKLPTHASTTGYIIEPVSQLQQPLQGAHLATDQKECFEWVLGAVFTNIDYPMLRVGLQRCV